MGLTVAGDREADDEEVAVLREHLRELLVDHELDVAEPPLQDRPVGAKAGDPVSVNAILVTLAASGGVLTTLLGAVQAWLLRSSARHVVLEIDGDRLEVDGVTSEERRALTAAWLARHQQPTPPDTGDDG